MFVLILLAGHLIYYTCVSKSENFIDPGSVPATAHCPSPLTVAECNAIGSACNNKFNRVAFNHLSTSKRNKKIKKCKARRKAKAAAEAESEDDDE